MIALSSKALPAPVEKATDRPRRNSPDGAVTAVVTPPLYDSLEGGKGREMGEHK